MKKKKEIELKAMNLAVRHYSRRGYAVRYVHKDNVGYDMIASIENNFLCIEVKGLSSSNISVELTPNEYQTMLVNKDNYRVFIVTKTLSNRPNINIVHYSHECKNWIDQNRQVVNIDKKVGARLYF